MRGSEEQERAVRRARTFEEVVVLVVLGHGSTISAAPHGAAARAMLPPKPARGAAFLTRLAQACNGPELGLGAGTREARRPAAARTRSEHPRAASPFSRSRTRSPPADTPARIVLCFPSAAAAPLLHGCPPHEHVRVFFCAGSDTGTGRRDERGRGRGSGGREAQEDEQDPPAGAAAARRGGARVGRAHAHARARHGFGPSRRGANRQKGPGTTCDPGDGWCTRPCPLPNKPASLPRFLRICGSCSARSKRPRASAPAVAAVRGAVGARRRLSRGGRCHAAPPAAQARRCSRRLPCVPI